MIGLCVFRRLSIVAPLLAAAVSIGSFPTLSHAENGVGSGAAPVAAPSAPPGSRLTNPEWFRDEPAAPRGGPVMGAPGFGAPAPRADRGAAEDLRDPGAAQPPPAAPGDAQARPQQGPIFRPPAPPYAGTGGYYHGYGGYPAYEVNNVVLAQARAATARALFRRAESELGRAYRAAQREFDRSQEVREALAAEKTAYEQLVAARRKAISTLADDTRYTRLLALKADVAEQLAQGRASRALGPAEILAMASLKMAHATDIRAMEANALNNEPDVKTAQDRLVAAGTRVAEVRQRHDESLRENPDILMARRNLDDARLAKLTAEAFLHAAYGAGVTALDYSYWVNRRAYGSSGYGIGYDAYGSGYGYGRY
jgi:hypothetical protein